MMPTFMMPSWDLPMVLFVGCLAALTLLAAVWDVRTRRIPNALTLGGLVLGFVHQGVFSGPAGLADGAFGFAVGFGTFLVLWLIGGGGGGDVKLMGALGVWLGLKLTLLVIVVSTVFVLVGSVLVIAGSFISRGVLRTKAKYVSSGVSPRKKGRRSRPRKTSERKTSERQGRRLMAFALPVSLATWVVVILDAMADLSGTGAG